MKLMNESQEIGGLDEGRKASVERRSEVVGRVHRR